MTSSFKASLCLLLVSVALLGAVAHPASAQAAGAPCWKTLLNDWYDGRIDHAYARHCYSDALKHLPADVQTYSSAHDDILRALQSAIAKQRKAGHTVGANTPIAPTGGTGSKSTTGTNGGATNGGSVTDTTAGRDKNTGIPGLADKLNPGSASSLPLPLLVLGGLALLLVAAGGAGLVAKRVQARRQDS